MNTLSHNETHKARSYFKQLATRCLHHGLYGAPLDERDKRRTNKLGKLLLPITTTTSINPIRL